jgi:lipid A ethanolaminephosphotransferase
MTGFDLEQLDGYVCVRERETGRKAWEMDFSAIDDIERIVSENDRSFIYLIKTGAHFPYDDKYPPDQAISQLASPGQASAGNREKTLDSYKNALRWTVDRFLEELSARLGSSGEEIVVVYTADHGQSLRRAVDDDGVAVRWLHASPVSPPVEQAMVPLLLFGFGGDVHARLERLFDESLVDRVSGYEIFPALLHLAGFDPADIRARYHHSLFDRDAPRDSRQFISGNLFGIGGGFHDRPMIQSGAYLNDFTLDHSERTDLPPR